MLSNFDLNLYVLDEWSWETFLYVYCVFWYGNLCFKCLKIFNTFFSCLILLICKSSLYIIDESFVRHKFVFANNFHPVACLFSFLIIQFSSFTQSCQTLRPHEPQHARPPCPSPTPRFTQTPVHRVSDAIQPSHPLSSPSSPTLDLSQHQGLLQWVRSSHQVAKGLQFQLQHQSFQWTLRTDLL